MRVRGQQGPGRTKQGTGGVAQGQESAPVRPYEEAYAEYGEAASSYLDDHYIPITQKDLVRQYFEQIEPAKADK